MTLSLIDRLPVGRRTEFLRKLSLNAVKRQNSGANVLTPGKPLPGDTPFARAPRAWTGRLAFLGIEIIEIYDNVGVNTLAFGFPTADLPVAVIVDPNGQGAVPADITAGETGALNLLDYTGASGTAPWAVACADVGVTTKGAALVTA
jgi:hypothetical protein